MFTFEGIATPIITPFDKDGKIDERAYRELIDWLIEQGVHGIVPAGSNGEAIYLSLDERVRLIEIAVEQADSRVPVIAGTGCPSTRATIEMTSFADEIGVDAVLIVTPFYFPLSQADLAEHYRRIADATKLPIFLYNVPKFTHVNLEPETVTQLSQIDNIVGIKDSSGNIEQVKCIISSSQEWFLVLAGTGSMLYDTLRLGGKGGILALSNIVPDKCVQIYNLCKHGQLEEARKLNLSLLELNYAITAEFGIPGLKAALKVRGLPAGYPRSPLRSVNSGQEAKIRRILDKIW